MAARRLPLALLAAPLFAAAGCAAPGPYPSLAQRPAEREFAEESDRVPAASAPQADDPAVAERIASLAAEARRGEEEFDAAYAPAAAAAAKAGAAGSDGWVEAQQAVSRAASAQGRTTHALADLDRFALERADRLSPGDRGRLKAATAEMQALADGQAERVARLEERLRR